MIDIKQIRDNPEAFKAACEAKKFDVDIDKLLAVDAELRTVKQQLQDISTDKNRIGKSIPKLPPDEKESALSQLSELKQRETVYNEDLGSLQPQFDELMQQVPQPADEDVPIGKDDTENVEIRKEGDVHQFDFEPKDHVQLGLALDIIDVERGVKLAGSRNYFLKGEGALLHWAILRFAMDTMTGKGYVPLSVPLLMKDEAMRGTGYYPGSEDQTYRTEEDQPTLADESITTKLVPGSEDQTYRSEEDKPALADESITTSLVPGSEAMPRNVFPTTEKSKLNLAGTAEVPLTAYHMGEILSVEQLPLKYVALSSCFRREAGAAGKDTYGLYRIHQFDKVEQVVICENSIDQSNKYHEEILANAEAVMQALELPYRVVNVCTGDLGRGQAKKYDIEAWMPSRGNYCETHSASKFYEFQARRMNLRYKDPNAKRNLFCHTLNNTVIASPRILIPILELYQNADGSITIPEVLRPYMNGRERIVNSEA